MAPMSTRLGPARLRPFELGRFCWRSERLTRDLELACMPSSEDFGVVSIQLIVVTLYSSQSMRERHRQRATESFAAWFEEGTAGLEQLTAQA